MFLRIAGRRKKNYSDEELATLFRKGGDMELLGELYGRHMELVFAVCMKYLKNEESAKDAVMQLFEKLSVNLRKHEIDNFKAWLHQVTRNYCLMQLRSAPNRFRDNMLSIENEHTIGMKNDHVLHHDKEGLEIQLNHMEAGIEQLPGEQQQCIRLFYLEQKCYKDIADSTGYELKKVKSYIQNGKRNLKLFMEARKNEE